jgi:hypothetical protein
MTHKPVTLLYLRLLLRSRQRCYYQWVEQRDKNRMVVYCYEHEVSQVEAALLMIWTTGDTKFLPTTRYGSLFTRRPYFDGSRWACMTTWQSKTYCERLTQASSGRRLFKRVLQKANAKGDFKECNRIQTATEIIHDLASSDGNQNWQ